MKSINHLRTVCLVILAACAVGVTVLWAVPPPPSHDEDADWMLDEWEIQYFGSLSQTGSGDYDGDGVSNLDEYNAGLDPTSADSDGDNNIDQLFRVLILRPTKGSSL